MNKRAARKVALKMAIALIVKEIDSPTDLSVCNDIGELYPAADRKRISEQLEIISDRLLAEFQRLARNG